MIDLCEGEFGDGICANGFLDPKKLFNLVPVTGLIRLIVAFLVTFRDQLVIESIDSLILRPLICKQL